MQFKQTVNLLSVLGLVLLGSVSAMADEHGLANIHGEPAIDLKVQDHAIAGSIRDFVVFGNVDEARFHAELLMKREGQLVKADFQRENGILGGTLSHEKDGQMLMTRIEFVRLDAATQSFVMKINGVEHTIQIQGDSFENNHFQNPKYTTEIAGQPTWFHMQGGQACYRFSVFLGMMIFGAVAH